MSNADKIVKSNETIINNKETDKNSEVKEMDKKQTEINQEQAMEEQEGKIEKMMDSIDAKMEKIEATIEGVEVGSAEYQQAEFITNVASGSAGIIMAVIGAVLLMKARKIEGKSKKKIAGWILLGLGAAAVVSAALQMFIM